MEFVGNKKTACFCGSAKCSGQIGEKPKETDKKPEKKLQAIKKKAKRKSSANVRNFTLKKPQDFEDPFVALMECNDPFICMLDKMVDDTFIDNGEDKDSVLKAEAIAESIEYKGEKEGLTAEMETENTSIAVEDHTIAKSADIKEKFIPELEVVENQVIVKPEHDETRSVVESGGVKEDSFGDLDNYDKQALVNSEVVEDFIIAKPEVFENQPIESSLIAMEVS